MLKVAFDLLFLRSHPMVDFNFPVWQSVVLLTILGVLSGLDPALNVPNTLVGVLVGLVTIWLIFSFGVKFMSWWLKRKKYWDGQGNLFNILVVTSLIDIVPAVLVIFGIPCLLTLPLWLYSLLIAGNAIKGATNSSTGYAISGLVLWPVIAFSFIIIIIGLLGSFISYLAGL